LPVPTVAVESPEAGQVYDHGKPVITGTFSGAAPIAVALSIDGKAVEAEVNDNNQFTYTPAEALSDGEHMIAVKLIYPVRQLRYMRQLRVRCMILANLLLQVSSQVLQCQYH
jgi:hypothetical protein